MRRDADFKDSDRDREANVVAAAVATLGVVAGSLPWPAYSQLLGRFLRLLAAHGEEKKVFLFLKRRFLLKENGESGPAMTCHEFDARPLLGPAGSL